MPASNYIAPTVPSTAAPTTHASTTTIASILGRLPVLPSTLPLATKSSNGHVSAVFPILCGAGFFVALMIVISRLIITRPRRSTKMRST